MSERARYDYRGCQSLFGYALVIHERSGGVCQLCGAGADRDPDFDFWRQLTVEHLIGESQGGAYRQILLALRKKFPTTPAPELEGRAEQLERENMVTACHFCNSTTSGSRHSVTMGQLVSGAGATWSDVLSAVQTEVQTILKRKRADVAWKLTSIRGEFERQVLPKLHLSRKGRRAT